MGKKRFLGIVFMMLLLAAAGQAQVTVTGTDTYPADVANLQAAVAANATIYLSGTFNFGTDGSVLIDVPNVTLEGVATGATIKGGTNPISTDNGSPVSLAKNVTIRNIHFIGWNESAVVIKGVQAEDNHTLIEGNKFDNTTTPADPLYKAGILYRQCAGSAEIRNNTLNDFTYEAIWAVELSLHMNDRLLVEGNKIINCTSGGISVGIWDPAKGVDQDNGPVIIRNNEININWTFCWGIDLGGDFATGVSNAVIEGNVITGYGDAGILGWSYGHHRKIINNDLSALTTLEPNILDCGRGDLIAGNVLGTTDPETAASVLGYSFTSTGIWLAAANPAALFGLNLPEPLPVTNNILMGNDYRRSGFKGWATDASGKAASFGCVLLVSWADLVALPPWQGAEITNNLVMEVGLFPRGTGGPKQQILEFPVYAHGNRIIGHAANEYAQLEAANPGIGRKIKESIANSVLLMKNRRASVRQAHNK